MASNTYLHSEITSLIIRAFYTVFNTLGYGFLEKVYRNALVIELKKLGLIVLAEQIIEVYYAGEIIGVYVTDIIVNERVIIEIKTGEALCYDHECQLLNYLKATNIEVGILLNFGKKPEFKRKVFSKEFKSC